MQIESSSASPRCTGSAGIDTTSDGWRRSSSPSPFCAPRTSGGSASAVERLTRISPASAVFSINTVWLAAGPVTISSRWEEPTRKRWKTPLLTPTDIRSVTRPAEVSIRPIERSSLRIPNAARVARTAWSSSAKKSMSASPPNFTRLPPFSYATTRSRAKTDPRTSVTSSAPTLPWRASRSDIFVNPEMSTKTTEPSSSRTVVPGVSFSQEISRRGRYGRNRCAASTDRSERSVLWWGDGTERV